jgi:L-lactate permease
MTIILTIIEIVMAITCFITSFIGVFSFGMPLDWAISPFFYGVILGVVAISNILRGDF